MHNEEPDFDIKEVETLPELLADARDSVLGLASALGVREELSREIRRAVDMEEWEYERRYRTARKAGVDLASDPDRSCYAYYYMGTPIPLITLPSLR